MICKTCGTPIRQEGGKWIHYRSYQNSHDAVPQNIEYDEQIVVKYSPPPNFFFGGDAHVMGEMTERIHDLDGVEVEVISKGVTGKITHTLINRDRRLAEIWVQFSSGVRAFRPHHLRRIDGKLLDYHK